MNLLKFSVTKGTEKYCESLLNLYDLEENERLDQALKEGWRVLMKGFYGFKINCISIYMCHLCIFRPIYTHNNYTKAVFKNDQQKKKDGKTVIIFYKAVNHTSCDCFLGKV